MNYRFHPHQLWTLVGGIMVVNNVVHLNQPNRQTSTIARRHKRITVLLLLAYAYHFLWERH